MCAQGVASRTCPDTVDLRRKRRPNHDSFVDDGFAPRLLVRLMGASPSSASPAGSAAAPAAAAGDNADAEPCGIVEEAAADGNSPLSPRLRVGWRGGRGGAVPAAADGAAAVGDVTVGGLAAATPYGVATARELSMLYVRRSRVFGSGTRWAADAGGRAGGASAVAPDARGDGEAELDGVSDGATDEAGVLSAASAGPAACVPGALEDGAAADTSAAPGKQAATEGPPRHGTARTRTHASHA